jgi:hypothetical protein
VFTTLDALLALLMAVVMLVFLGSIDPFAEF